MLQGNNLRETTGSMAQINIRRLSFLLSGYDSNIAISR
jgi:hypothetical protein